jgi:hypothetical protein
MKPMRALAAIWCACACACGWYMAPSCRGVVTGELPGDGDELADECTGVVLADEASGVAGDEVPEGTVCCRGGVPFGSYSWADLGGGRSYGWRACGAGICIMYGAPYAAAGE